MPELTITSPYVDSRVDFQLMNHGQPYARIGLNPMPESTLSSWKELRIWPESPLHLLVKHPENHHLATGHDRTRAPKDDSAGKPGYSTKGLAIQNYKI